MWLTNRDSLFCEEIPCLLAASYNFLNADINWVPGARAERMNHRADSKYTFCILDWMEPTVQGYRIGPNHIYLKHLKES